MKWLIRPRCHEIFIGKVFYNPLLLLGNVDVGDAMDNDALSVQQDGSNSKGLLTGSSITSGPDEKYLNAIYVDTEFAHLETYTVHDDLQRLRDAQESVAAIEKLYETGGRDFSLISAKEKLELLNVLTETTPINGEEAGQQTYEELVGEIKTAVQRLAEVMAEVKSAAASKAEAVDGEGKEIHNEIVRLSNELTPQRASVSLHKIVAKVAEIELGNSPGGLQYQDATEYDFDADYEGFSGLRERGVHSVFDYASMDPEAFDAYYGGMIKEYRELREHYLSVAKKIFGEDIVNEDKMDEVKNSLRYEMAVGEFSNLMHEYGAYTHLNEYRRYTKGLNHICIDDKTKSQEQVQKELKELQGLLDVGCLPGVRRTMQHGNRLFVDIDQNAPLFGPDMGRGTHTFLQQFQRASNELSPGN